MNDIYSTAHDGAAAAAAVNGRTSASSDALLLVEHSSVYTLGRYGIRGLLTWSCVFMC